MRLCYVGPYGIRSNSVRHEPYHSHCHATSYWRQRAYVATRVQAIIVSSRALDPKEGIDKEPWKLHRHTDAAGSKLKSPRAESANLTPLSLVTSLPNHENADGGV